MKAVLASLFIIIALIFGFQSVDAQQGSWSQLAKVGEARQEVGVAELGGKIYFIGGFTVKTGRFDVARTVEVYDPKIDRWSFVAPLPEPLHHTSAVSLDGRLYVIGGYNTLSFAPVSSAYRYDPATNIWSAIANLPTSRGALASVVIGKKIYTVGGESRGLDTGDLTVYDPTANQWTQAAPMPSPRDHICAGVINGKLYVAGGRGPTGFTLNILEEYDPASNTWRTRAPMPTGRSGIAGAVAGNRFYVFGGEGNPRSITGTFEQNESYDPATDSWRAEVPMPTPRHGIGAAVIDSRIYIPGGSPVIGFGVTDINEAFNVAGQPQQNRPPIIEAIPAQTIRGGQEQCIDLRVSDPEGDMVTVSCAPENPSFARCVQNAICLNPGPAIEGDFTVCAVAKDTAGNQTKACFAVTVIINHRPRLETTFPNITIREGDALALRVKATDEDAVRDPAMDGRLSLVLAEGPNFAKLTDEGSGTGILNVTPGLGFGGGGQQVFAITIEARDNGAPPLKAATGFLLTVTAPPQPATPLITSAVFGNKKLTITGLRFGLLPQLEINGSLADPSRFTLQSDTQIALSGNKKKLNLKRGANTAVVAVNGVRSAPFSFTVGK